MRLALGVKLRENSFAMEAKKSAKYLLLPFLEIHARYVSVIVYNIH